MKKSNLEKARQSAKGTTYKFQKSIHPSIWLTLFLIALLVAPAALAIKLDLSGHERLLLWHFLSSPEEWQYLALAVVVLLYSSFFVYSVNAAFAFLRKLAGYPARKQGTIFAWLRWKLRVAAMTKRSTTGAKDA